MSDYDKTVYSVTENHFITRKPIKVKRKQRKDGTTVITITTESTIEPRIKKVK